jgi:glycosyltransferase involved in cell wall biosynthesis
MLSRRDVSGESLTNVLVLSVVPSPYQRDLFKALASRPGLNLKVSYMEGTCAGYPWPENDLESWEEVLPGSRIDRSELRLHWNTRLPAFENFDIVVMNTYLTALTTQWVMRTALSGQKWMFWGEQLRWQKSKWRQSLQNWLSAPLRRASAIVAIGSRAEKDYRSRFPESRTFNIPYHCALSAFLSKPRHGERAKEITFLFCGVMSRRKGVDLLLRAFDRLVRSGAAVRLHLVGQEAELPSFLQQIGPQTRAHVHYEGFHPPGELPDLFSRADVFVLPSRHDGWGVVVNQALAAGLPVVCSSAVGAGHDLIETEMNGLRFSEGDETELYGCLKRFVDAPGLCLQWGSISRKKALNWLPEVGAAKWSDAIQQVLNRAS